MQTPEARWRLPVLGALLGLLGVAASLLVGSVLRDRLSPVTAMAEAVIDYTPGVIAEPLISLVGAADKPILVAATVLVIALASAWAAAASRRSTLMAYAVYLSMAALGAAAVITRPGATPNAAISVVVGAGVWIAGLAYIMNCELSPGAASGSEMAHRREFLKRAGVLGAGVVVLGVAAGLLGRGRRAVEASRAGLQLRASKPVVPAGAQLRNLAISPWLTPASSFYRIDTAVVVPAIRPEEWSLRIHGLVERELTFTYDDLLAETQSEAWVTLCCVSNPVGGDLVGNAWWSGVRVADLLARAGVKPGADAVRQTSADGWDCGTPLSALTDDRSALLAVAMNGAPLPIEHGFPVRMVVPGLYGFVSATKWVTDLEVTRFADFDAFWTARGWAEQCDIRTQSRIDVPRSGARVSAGEVLVGGVAFSQHVGIAQVEVSLDGGTWAAMELGAGSNDDTWVQWGGMVPAAAGSHTLSVRATDKAGYTQEAVKRDVVPDGATGWHSVDFRST